MGTHLSGKIRAVQQILQRLGLGLGVGREHVLVATLKSYEYSFEGKKELCSTCVGPIFSPDQN